MDRHASDVMRKDARRLRFKVVVVLLMVPRRSSARLKDVKSKRFSLECARSITIRTLELVLEDVVAILAHEIRRLLSWHLPLHLQQLVLAKERGHLILAACQFFKK
jgi:hypothetical protein